VAISSFAGGEALEVADAEGCGFVVVAGELLGELGELLEGLLAFSDLLFEDRPRRAWCAVGVGHRVLPPWCSGCVVAVGRF
jgi:hypothetical protein